MKLGRTSLRSSALLVGAVSAVASVVALVRDVIVSRSAGFGNELDTWSVALAWTTVGMSALVSGIGAAIVPVFGRARHTERAAGQGSEIDVLIVTGAAGLALGATLFVSAGPVAAVLAPQASERNMESVLRVMSVLVILPAAVRGSAAGLLQAAHRFAAPAITTMLTSLAVIVAAFTGTVDAERLAIAHGIGVTTEAVLLTAALARSGAAGASFAGCRTLVRTLVRPVATTALGSLLFGVGPVIDLWFAGRVDQGKAGQLAVAGRIPLAVAALLTTAFATPAFPMIVERARAGARGALAGTHDATRSAWWIAAGAVALILVLSLPTASIAFRGSEVTPEEARSVAIVQMIYALTIPSYIAGTLHARGLQAIGRYGTVFWVGCIGAGTNAALDWWLSELFGLRGIAAATALVYAFVLVLMRFELQRLAHLERDSGPPGD